MKFLSFAAVLFALALFAQEPPPGWKFHGEGTGGVTDDGHLYVEANRQQQETDWLSPALNLIPGALYRLDFDLLVSEGAEGNVTPGLVNYSVDTKRLSDTWQHESLTLPAPREPDRMRIRLGAWKLGGRAEFKDWRLRRALPIFLDCGNGIALGDGERIDRNTYTFTQSFQTDGPARTRLLPQLDNIRYNTSRFCLEKPDACVTYAISVPGRRKMHSATLELYVNYHSRGKLVVDASPNGQSWTTLDTLDSTGSINVTLPKSFFPATTIYFRFHAEGATYLQVNRVCYTAQLDGAPLAVPAIGQTHFALAEAEDARLAVQFLPITPLLPGKHEIAVQVTNKTNQPLRLQPTTAIEPADVRTVGWQGDELLLKPRQTATLNIPVTLPDAGDWQIHLALGGDSATAYTIEAKIHEIQRIDYGAVLREDETAVLWSAEAGWHVSRERIAPIARDSALRIQAAANEAEAVQLVLRPDRDLTGVTLAASALTGPGNSALPAECVEILREYYHYIELPTDGYGYQGYVPDALPPIDAPLDLAADQNQPFWVRVKVPAGTPAGTYTGTITVQDAAGWSAAVPLEVEVFGFDLPDRMTLETAFGFNQNQPFRYHQPADEAQRRQLVDQYFQALADHHLSPYDPAPLDRWRYEIRRKNGLAWQGPGQLDATTKSHGESSLKIIDDTDAARAIHATQQHLPLPDAPMQFSLQYRTAEAGQVCSMYVMFYDADDQWLTGKNQTFDFTGDGSWQTAAQKLAAYPENARSFSVNLNPLTWTKGGQATGTAWFDDLLFQTADGTAVLAEDFELAKLEDLQVVFDWTRWDAAVERSLAKFHFNTIDISVDALHSAVEIDGKKLARFGGYLEGTPEFTYLHRQYLHGIQEHLREKGWLDMSYVYWFDEPTEEDYPYVMNGLRKLREGAPDLRRFLTEQVEPELIGGPNLWCPVSYKTVLSTIAERQAAGEDFWWYVCTGPKMPYATLFTDHPATNLRVWLWQTWQHHVQGVLIWATTYWNCEHLYKDQLQNPYLDTMSWAAGYNFVKPGQRSPWGNGDGRFFYPPLATVNRTDDQPNLELPVDSIRSEMLRDGIEDYEYCVILQRLRDEKADALAPAELSRINALLTVPPQISQDMTHFTHSPEPILKRRAEIGRAITELLRK